MRRLVVDASVALKWLTVEADADLAQTVRMRAELIAPDLLLAECGNALWKKARRGEIDTDYADLAVRLLQHVTVDFRPMRSLMQPALGLARRFDHPVYDCIYLALAMAEACSFVTADHRLLGRLPQDWADVEVLTLTEAAAAL